ncbi:unnamed protein product, partial [Meganyctiphanes norvegica]
KYEIVQLFTVMRALSLLLILLALASGTKGRRNTLIRQSLLTRVESVAENGDPWIKFRAVQSVGVGGGCSCGCGGLPSVHEALSVDNCQTKESCHQYASSCRPDVTSCLDGEKAIEDGCGSPTCRCCVGADAEEVINQVITGGGPSGFEDGSVIGGWSNSSNITGGGSWGNGSFSN